jgi:hypothetical protein
MGDQQGGGSAERDLATPETAVQNVNDKKQDDAPSAKAMETPTDEKLPEDQQAMQPDSN